jgi:hypothetical protein
MAVILRAGLSVGETSAEEDEALLSACFEDTGYLHELTSTSSPKCIVLGRTGSGKSALLSEIERREKNVIRIDPENLSLNFISNSDIIQFFEKLDIKLDVFYQLLWRHILAVELIKTKKQIYNEAASKNWIGSLLSKFRSDPKKMRAIEYLFQFGDSFWADTEARVREVVVNIENKLTDQSGFDVKAWNAKLKSDLAESKTDAISQTTEIIHKAQKVVNDVQIQELNSVIDLLADDIFGDTREHIYIVIDDLDKDWAHDSIRFKLIRALIETIKKFRRISNLKIVISLRYDLLETVLKNTAASGFQTEKYENMFLRIRWNKDQLRKMTESRINFVFKQQYTSQTVGIYDILTRKVGDQDAFEYILERTLERPRGVISFLNQCLEEGAGQTTISARVIRNAESGYSSKRLTYLADEWREVYGSIEPALRRLSAFRKARFRMDELNSDWIDDLCLTVLEEDQGGLTRYTFSAECNQLANGSVGWSHIKKRYLDSLYVIGAVGVKFQPGAPFEWSFRNDPLLEHTRLSAETVFAIHPMLFKALNVYADPGRVV